MAYLKEMLFFFVRSWIPKIQAIRNNLLLTNPCDIGGAIRVARADVFSY